MATKSNIQKLADKYAFPHVYENGSDGYKEIGDLDLNDWQEFLDELAKKGLTCTYNMHHDTYTVG